MPQLKGQLSDLRQLLTTETLLKMIKSVYYFMSKAFLLRFIQKRLNKEVKVKSKIYVFTGLASSPHFLSEKTYFSFYILLSDKISWAYWLNLLKYWTIFVSYFFLFRSVKS